MARSVTSKRSPSFGTGLMGKVPCGKAGPINPSSTRVGTLEAPFSSLLAFSTLDLDTRLNHAEQGVPTRMLYGTTGVDFSRQEHFHPTHWCFLFPGQHGCGRRVL